MNNEQLQNAVDFEASQYLFLGVVAQAYATILPEVSNSIK